MSTTLQELSTRFAEWLGVTPTVMSPAAPASAPAPTASAANAPTVPAVPTMPAAPAVAATYVHTVEYARKGYHLDIQVLSTQVVKAAHLLDKAGFSVDTITGVDWLANNEMEVVYDYFHCATNWRVVVRCRVPRAQPELPTISTVLPGADWHERETHDFFGIRFLGHPDLSPLLLPEDATYHPLKKDFTS